MDLMGMFKQQMTNQVINQVAKQVGLTDNNQTQSAANNIVSTLMGAIAKNAATPQGAESLNKALENDHDGGILDNVMSFFDQGQPNPVSDRAANGAGILKHVLGNNQANIVQALSKTNGMSAESTQSMMTSLAPMVMGMLGKAKKEQGLDASNIASFLGKQPAPQNNNQLSGIMNLLDSDGDGSVVDDVTNILGGFFGKK